MWGDLVLLQFYPRNWQASFYRSLHPWLLHMSLWHYWLWFTFLIAMNLYFIYVFKTCSFNRADIRGKRSTGERRRLAWSEIIVCILPLFWSVNIISNAMTYLRVLENNGGYVLLSVQVSAYQWGWKYCYGDTFYPKYFSIPVKLGNGIHMLNNEGVYLKPSISVFDKLNNYKIVFTNDFIIWQSMVELRELCIRFRHIGFEEFIRERWNESIWSFLYINNEMLGEVYFCRWYLKELGILESEYKNSIQNQMFHSGYWVTAQGIDPNMVVEKDLNNSIKQITYDSLRLLRSTGALVLPTRGTIRLMACSEDITHSWAVPGLGIKMDCVPGRLFCLFTNIVREGIYFGQCSELCGWNHYNMPVVLYALPTEHFIIWWELELHTVFNESTNELFRSHEESKIMFYNNIEQLNYSNLNVKYK